MKSEITKLIDKYNREKGKRYNKEATNNDFILPLFKILGWNTEDSNEVSKEENASLELNYINKPFYQNLELLIVHWLCLIVPSRVQWGACQLLFLNI